MGAETDQKVKGSVLEIWARYVNTNIVKQWWDDTESGMSK